MYICHVLSDATRPPMKKEGFGVATGSVIGSHNKCKALEEANKVTGTCIRFRFPFRFMSQEMLLRLILERCVRKRCDPGDCDIDGDQWCR
jgi:hypothetical protein